MKKKMIQQFNNGLSKLSYTGSTKSHDIPLDLKKYYACQIER